MEGLLLKLTYRTGSGEIVRRFTPPRGWTMADLKNDLDRASAECGTTVRAFVRLADMASA